MNEVNPKEVNLYNLGLSDTIAQEAAIYGNHLYLARVSAQHRDMYKVISSQGQISAEVSGKLMYSAAFVAAYPAVGDWVLVDRTEDKTGNAIIHHILTRKSCFARKSSRKGYEQQVIAANIDTLF